MALAISMMLFDEDVASNNAYDNDFYYEGKGEHLVNRMVLLISES